MDISSSGPTQPGGIRDQHRVQSLGQSQRKAQENVRRRQEADAVILSEHGQMLQKLADAVKNAPDAREEKVAELRDAIQTGRYEYSAAEIAKAILASRLK